MLDFLLRERKILQDFFKGRSDIEFTDMYENDRIKGSFDNFTKELISFAKTRE